MTDIDALIDEARKLFLIGIAPGGEETMAGRLIDALTTERAKVAALEAEVARWRKVAGELAGALRKELFEAVNCWVHHDGENPEGSAEPEHIIQGRAALTRFKQEGGQ